MGEQQLKTCKDFKGDRPCNHYWIDKCCQNDPNSPYYNEYSHRILLIKLDALGDVMRSTALVKGIKKKYPNSQLTWLVKENAKSFIKYNSDIDRIMIYNDENTRILQCEKFNILINLDKDAKATSMTMLFKSDIKRGYGLHKNGYPIPLNKSSKYHYDICLDNYGKKTKNTKSYQELIYEIAEIEYNNEKPVLFLNNKKDKFFKDKFFKDNNINNKNKIIILNTGCGPVYPHKKWTYKGYKNLIKKLIEDNNRKIILTGAKTEIERNSKLCSEFPNLINTTNQYSIEEFCSLINLSDIVVTGDTVALHIAISLNKNIVSFFGPTPHQEIDLFGLGEKHVRKELDCLNCYDQFPCPYEGKCMSLIKSKEVWNSVLKYI
jgi:heptosyltransferase-2